MVIESSIKIWKTLTELGNLRQSLGRKGRERFHKIERNNVFASEWERKRSVVGVVVFWGKKMEGLLTVVVTGGAGFVGARIVHYLAESGLCKEIRIFDTRLAGMQWIEIRGRREMHLRCNLKVYTCMFTNRFMCIAIASHFPTLSS